MLLSHTNTVWGTNGYIIFMVKKGMGIIMLYKITSFNNDIVFYM